MFAIVRFTAVAAAAVSTETDENMLGAVSFLVLLLLYACNNHVLSDPHGGGNSQWSNPRVGMIGDHQQQHQGFAGGQQQGYNGQQHGYGGQRGFGGNNFGGQQNGGGRYSGQGRGGQQQWQSGQGSEAYKTNVFNEPDRYGYDSTFPGATVHYLVYKKQGNRGFGGYGGNQGGWNKNY